jgi:hypothetical protein
MKLIAEGKLRNEVDRAIRYVNSLLFVDSFIIGMLKREEIEENCSLMGNG